MTIKRSQNPCDLCSFKFSDGRYCSLPGIPSLGGLCRYHGKKNTAPRPSVEHNEMIFLEPFAGDMPTPEEIRVSLAVVFRALAAGRISTRRAATMGYLGQILLAKHANEAADNLSRIFLHPQTVANLEDASEPAPSKFPPDTIPEASRRVQNH